MRNGSEIRQDEFIPVHVVIRRGHDLEQTNSIFFFSFTILSNLMGFEGSKWRRLGRGGFFLYFIYLRHHATPGDEISRASRPGPLLQVDDALEETVEVVVGGVIELLEGIEAFREIGA